jgi:hypothetical protein
LLQGQSVIARELAEQAAAAFNSPDIVANRCSPLGVVGRTQLASGEPELALSTFEQLITVAGVAPYPCRQADGYEGAAAAAVALGLTEIAARNLAIADQLRQQTHSRPVPRPVIDEHLSRLAVGRPTAEKAIERIRASSPQAS